VIKAGAVIEPGNIIEINFGRRRLKVEVCMLKETVPARMVSEMYRVIEERKITSEEDHL
jgi:ribosomal 50S subunit-recycling heat shock protein